MDWIVANWPWIAGSVIPVLLTVIGLIAEKTPFDWDNKILAVVRKIWGLVPIGQMNPKLMGKVPKGRMLEHMRSKRKGGEIDLSKIPRGKLLNRIFGRKG